MWIDAQCARRRTVRATVAGAASLAAMLGVTASPAAAAYTAQVQNGTLQITGDGASDKLSLRLAPDDPNTLQVDVGEDGTTDLAFDRSTFSTINVRAGGGDDEVRVDQSFGSFADQPLTIDGGAGDDTLIGGDGNDTLIGGSGNDSIDGGRGSDVALMGAGKDKFTWNPGDGSDTVEGQGGKDAMDFNGSNAPENIDVSANGSRVRLHRDVANVTIDMNGIDALNVAALGGADTVTVNDLTGTALTAANVDLGALGGGGDGAPDTVIANGTGGPDDVRVTRSGSEVLVKGLPAQIGITGSEPANDALDINTLAGDDDAKVAPDVSQLIAPSVDLGADQ